MRIRQAKKVSKQYARGNFGIIASCFGTIITAINKMKSYSKRRGIRRRDPGLPGHYNDARNNCN